MTKREYEILKKYIKGRWVDKEDKPILDRWSNIGYVTHGYSMHRDCGTAKLTDRGKRMIRREKIQRNPVKRFFYNYSTYLF